MSMDYDSVIQMLRVNSSGNTLNGVPVSPLEYLCHEYCTLPDLFFESENKELLEQVIRLMAVHEEHKIIARPSYVASESNMSAMCVVVVFSCAAEDTDNRAVQFINRHIRVSCVDGTEKYSWVKSRNRRNSC
jgi:hypothetical protein